MKSTYVTFFKSSHNLSQWSEVLSELRERDPDVADLTRWLALVDSLEAGDTASKHWISLGLVEATCTLDSDACIEMQHSCQCKGVQQDPKRDWRA